MKSRTATWIIGFCIPMTAIVLAFPLYNRVEPQILGFPFVYFWVFIWLVLTSVCLMIGFRLDPYNTKDAVDVTDTTLQEVKIELAEDEKNMNEQNKKGGDL